MSITLENPISQAPAAIVGTGILSAAPDMGTHHCVIQVMRLPQLDRVSIASGSTLEVTTPGFFEGGSEWGGIIALQIRKLEINGTFILNAGGKGYMSLYNGSYGVDGRNLTPPSHHENGGGSSSTYTAGGGGGQAGRGSDHVFDAATENTGASALTYCKSGSACLPFSDGKAFFGGGGGGDSAISGGNGGGAIFLFVEELVGSGTINFNANGNPNSSGNAGAGAGGSIVFVNRDMRSAVNTMVVNLEANGGTVTGNGGGGSVDIAYCPLLISGSGIPSFSTYVAAGTGSAAPSGEAAGGITAFYDILNLDSVRKTLCSNL